MALPVEVIPEQTIRRFFDRVDIETNQVFKLQVGSDMLINEKPATGKRWQAEILITIWEETA